MYAWQLPATVGGGRKAGTFSFFATLLAASHHFVLSLYSGPQAGVSRWVVQRIHDRRTDPPLHRILLW